MTLSILSIGTMKSKALKQAFDEYASRLKHYTRLELKCVRDEEQALQWMAMNDHVIACHADGEQLDSKAWASLLEKHHVHSTRRLVFFIGGADGHSEAVLERANQVLSFGTMTLAHELALVALAEQLYRAHTILKNEPYHRA